MDREACWPKPSPNHRLLPCDSESLPALRQQKQRETLRKDGFAVTRCV